MRQGCAEGSRLYRNLLVERARLVFKDVTDTLRLNTRCYATGVTAADIDNDGDLDLYLTCHAANELWRNDGTWTASATFVEVDGDGLLPARRHEIELPQAPRRNTTTCVLVREVPATLRRGDVQPSAWLTRLFGAEARARPSLATSTIAGSAGAPDDGRCYCVSPAVLLRKLIDGGAEACQERRRTTTSSAT